MEILCHIGCVVGVIIAGLFILKLVLTALGYFVIACLIWGALKYFIR